MIRILLTLLQLILIVLKIATVISWSWWWVLAPIWMGFVLAILGSLAFVVLMSKWW